MSIAALVAGLALAVSAPLAWPGRPAAPPPKAPNPGAPPPAWAESATTSSWLAYGSYCWRTACVDMIAPRSRSDLPIVHVRRGQRLRVHLAFVPREAHVTRFVGTSFRRSRLPARRILEWQARGAGIVVFELKGPKGSATYLARLRVR